MKVKSKKSLFAFAMALLMALSVGAMGIGALFNATATSAVPQIDTVLGTENVLYENFESAVVADKDANYKKISDNIEWYKDNGVSIITEANGNKALKLMYEENFEEGDGKPIAADQRSLVIRKQLVPWQQYRISFYMKRATNIWVRALMRSGIPSNNYGEKREVSTAGNGSFSETRSDWNYNDNKPETSDWTCSAGGGMNGFWNSGEGVYFSSDFSAFLGTDNQNPTWFKQAVALEPNTEYNFSFWVKRHGQGFDDSDKYSVGLTDDVQFLPHKLSSLPKCLNKILSNSISSWAE